MVNITNPEPLCSRWKRCTWTFPALQCPTYNETEQAGIYSIVCKVEGHVLHDAQYLQLETERDSKHLKSLHLKVYTNGSFVILVKDIFAKSSKADEKKRVKL